MRIAKTAPAVHFINDQFEIFCQLFDIPPILWKSNADIIVHKLVEDNYVTGDIVKGYWVGPLIENGKWTALSIRKHTWIKLALNTVVDPLRWSFFELEEPEIYAGKPDFYDEDGATVRKLVNTDAPPYIQSDVVVSSYLFEHILPEINHLLGYPYHITNRHLAWLAKQPPERLGNKADIIYSDIIRAGFYHLLSDKVKRYLFDDSHLASSWQAA